MEEEKKYTLVLSLANINTVVRGLGEIPLKDSFMTAQEIQNQVNEQTKLEKKENQK